MKFELETPGENGATDYALVWQVEGAQQVEIDGKPQTNTTAGRFPLTNIDQTTEHVLKASNGPITSTQTVGIVVLRPPEIQSLTADSGQDAAVPAGKSVKLTWSARRGERATLDGKSVDPNGGVTVVTPRESTTYTLEIENELGIASRSITVNVEPQD
jgi:hypothetical protein